MGKGLNRTLEVFKDPQGFVKWLSLNGLKLLLGRIGSRWGIDLSGNHDFSGNVRVFTHVKWLKPRGFSGKSPSINIILKVVSHVYGSV